MLFFDFHHHLSQNQGIYNLEPLEEVFPHYFSVGIHPKDIVIENLQLQLQRVQKLSRSPNCLALGECGLDALVSISHEVQTQAFAQQIEIANQVQKPIIVHCVRRFGDLVKFASMAEVDMVVHGFNRNANIAKMLLDTGFYLSFGKALLYNVSLQNIAKTIPANRFFLETDTSEEVSILHIYEKMASLRGCTIEDLGKQIEENINRIKIRL